MSSAKWRPFCPDEDELSGSIVFIDLGLVSPFDTVDTRQRKVSFYFEYIYTG